MTYIDAECRTSWLLGISRRVSSVFEWNFRGPRKRKLKKDDSLKPIRDPGYMHARYRASDMI